MRAPFQEGDLPGPVKYGYLSVGAVEAGPDATCSAARCSASTRTRTGTSSPPPRSRRCPTASRRAAPCSPARSRRPSTRSGTPRRGSATGSPWSAAGMVGCAPSPRCCAASRSAGWSSSTWTRAGPASADRLGVRFVHAGRRGRRLRPRRPLLGHGRRASPAGSSCWATRASCRAVLVRRPRGARATSAARFHARRLTVRASQVGAVAAARRARRTHADRLAPGARPAATTTPSTR